MDNDYNIHDNIWKKSRTNKNNINYNEKNYKENKTKG